MRCRPVILALVLAGGLACALAGCSRPEEPLLQAPEIHPGTAQEREDAIDALRETWRHRPMETSPENRQAERRFLSRTCSFLFRIKDTDEFVDGCNLWNECIHDYTQRYGDPNKKD